MQRHRDGAVEFPAGQPFISQSGMEPASNQMSQVDFATVFEIENDSTNEAAAAIGRDRRLEMQPAMSAVRAMEWTRYLSGERFGTSRTERRHNPNNVIVTFIAQVLVRRNAGRADRAKRWIKQRSEGAESFKFCERDHI